MAGDEGYEQFIQQVRSSAKEGIRTGEHTLMMLRYARLGAKLDDMTPDDLAPEDAVVLALHPKSTKEIDRIREKLEGNPPLGKLVAAALRHLEWKIDREAEGLRVFAGHPEQAPDEGEKDEPWKPGG